MATRKQPRTLCGRVGNQLLDRGRAAVVGKRTHDGSGVEAVADLNILGMRGKPFDKAVVHAFLHIEARWRNADLPGVAELGGGRQFDRLFQIAVVEDQHRCMAAQLHRRALDTIGREFQQMLADRHRPGEADFADDRRGNEVAADHIGNAVNQLCDITRNSPIDNAGHDRVGAGGRLFGWLGDDRATGGKSGRHFLAHQVDREIPRGKCRNRADGLLQHKHALPGGSHEHATIAALGFLGKIVELRRAGQDFTACFGKRFTLFGCQQYRDSFGTFADQPCDLVQYARAVVHVGFPPGSEAFGGRGQSFIEVRGSRHRQLRQRLAGRRIDYSMMVSSLIFAPFAVDKKRQIGGVGGGHVCKVLLILC